MARLSRRTLVLSFPAAAAVVWLSAGCGGGGGGGGNPSPSPTPTPNGTVVSSRQVTVFTRAQIDGVVASSGIPNLPPAQSDVKMIEVTYRTTDTDGTSTVASGLFAVPATGATNLPLVVYHHGTTYDRNNSPSNATSLEATALAALFAAQGYAVAAPDYIGLGKSTSKQTFEYAAGLAQTSLDMVRAARSVAPGQGATLSGKLFLTGYSEGGYATLAAQRAMEQIPGEFTVTASAPLEGPYDLSGTMLNAVLTSTQANVTAFAAGILTQQNRVGKFYTNESEVFVSPYNDGRVDVLFDGSHTDDQVVAALPSSPVQLLTPALVQAIQANPNHPVNVYLRANDIYDFTPIAPTRFFHAQDDTTVPFGNATVAVDRMQARGATNVSLVNLGEGLDHSTATVPAFLNAKLFFDGLK